MPRGKGKRPTRQRHGNRSIVLLAQGAGPVKRTQQHAYDPVGSDDATYVVEQILAERTHYGQPQFLIRWRDLGVGTGTWEPEENLPGHGSEIESFRETLRQQQAEIARKSDADKQDREQAATPSTTGKSSVKRGCIDALLPRPSAEQRDRIHRRVTLWLLRSGRPLTLPERGADFRGIFEEIFKEGYTPPCYHTVIDILLSSLSAEGKVKVMEALKKSLDLGILPSIAGDIWSEGGIAIFGVLVYWIDANFNYFERVLAAIPFSAVRHTGEELERATKEACSAIGIGKYGTLNADMFEDTVVDFVHCTVSDNATNIVKGWESFDGHECNCHTLALCVHTYLAADGVKEVFKKLRGMTGHFNHSVLGCKVLNDIQKTHQLPESKPPQDNDTRSGWGGSLQAS
ncbi:hypothetical protein CYMTET_21631 [Cymbomonas tetramitiformis]|uniref:Chromo domain-containing protein n=1 Tax=Cymbomonas tetramitiformis TaxID=36881 RepID=A0AAE0G256_9CHLO|nr:hypothetical protein CYMTET_21631 [Cymbomonas tetramitiformis]